MTVKERFWSKTKTSTEHSYNGTPCIDWTAGSDSSGYGQFGFNGRVQASHRVAHQLQHGDIPKGMHVLHRCDRPCCVNPEHLFLGTHRDNMIDMAKKGRHKSAGLNSSSVLLIKQFLQRHPVVIGDSKHSGQCNFLGRWFGVPRSVVTAINIGRTWKHITVEGASS